MDDRNSRLHPSLGADSAAPQHARLTCIGRSRKSRPSLGYGRVGKLRIRSVAQGLVRTRGIATPWRFYHRNPQIIQFTECDLQTMVSTPRVASRSFVHITRRYPDRAQ